MFWVLSVRDQGRGFTAAPNCACRPFYAQLNPCFDNGSERIRLPVAAKNRVAYCRQNRRKLGLVNEDAGNHKV